MPNVCSSLEKMTRSPPPIVRAMYDTLQDMITHERARRRKNQWTDSVHIADVVILHKCTKH